MKTFGLTGGAGMGKSAAGQWLAQRGVPVIDTDQIAHQLVEPGRPALTAIKIQFGGKIIAPDGTLRREELARIIFANVTARQKLETILHPRIAEQWQTQVAAWRNEGRPTAVVIIPLLFETRAASQFDRTICVACTPATQGRRLLQRGWTPEQIGQRLAAQWPIQKKIELADYVVWTEGSLEALGEQLQRIIP